MCERVATVRQRLLEDVIRDVALTNPQYTTLLYRIIAPHPLLYFGEPTTARFATFGVTPPANEWVRGRWPHSLTPTELDERLIRYFDGPVPPSRSFTGYDDPVSGNKALNILGHSYALDTAHLVISPRTAAPMSPRSAARNKSLFMRMLHADLRWFLSALSLCSRI